jgi:hypothetical protein
MINIKLHLLHYVRWIVQRSEFDQWIRRIALQS